MTAGSADGQAPPLRSRARLAWTSWLRAERMTRVHVWDRNFFLIILAVIWSGILAGFVPDILAHMAGGHVPFALIVHVHAAVYVGWLILLTTQMSLVRSRRVDLHRRLGLVSAIM